MERLSIWRPRSTQRQWMPMSGLITLNVHWYQRTWACGGEGCRLCQLVPVREVGYFAGRCRCGQGEPQLRLLERSTVLIEEAMRQSGIFWPEAVRRLVVTEQTSHRAIGVDSWYLFEECRGETVPLSRVAWSVARLYRFPHFPECSTAGEARRCIEAMSRRQQALQLSQATVVD
jgi:hypothetical protein